MVNNYLLLRAPSRAADRGPLECYRAPHGGTGRDTGQPLPARAKPSSSPWGGAPPLWANPTASGRLERADERLAEPTERPQGRTMFDMLRSGDTSVVRWVDRLSRRSHILIPSPQLSTKPGQVHRAHLEQHAP
jgi:hypothetical protein